MAANGSEAMSAQTENLLPKNHEAGVASARDPEDLFQIRRKA
jgi:hypothetical protein